MADPIPIACTLTTKQAADQLDEWAALRAQARSVEPIDGGVRVVLPSDMEPTARDLAAREAACCAFLTLAVDPVGDDVVVTITGPADAQPVIGLIVAP
ncbi:MAG: hypothetical protein AAGA90_23755 [Actinomycetota bacterium]